jgi:hypothetical protein
MKDLTNKTQNTPLTNILGCVQEQSLSTSKRPKKVLKNKPEKGFLPSKA